jgi:hypothetical protein
MTMMMMMMMIMMMMIISLSENGKGGKKVIFNHPSYVVAGYQVLERKRIRVCHEIDSYTDVVDT